MLARGHAHILELEPDFVMLMPAIKALACYRPPFCRVHFRWGGNGHSAVASPTNGPGTT